MKLTTAQKKMISRLENGYTIRYMRLWYTSGGMSQSKANDNTIEALIAMGILIETGVINKVGYSVTLKK